MGTPDHLTCLLRNLYAGQEATVRTGHGTKDWFRIGKGIMSRLYIVTLLNLHAEYIMRNARLDEAQAGIKIADSSLRTTWSEGLDGGRAPDRLSGDDLLGASQRGMSL